MTESSSAASHSRPRTTRFLMAAAGAVCAGAAVVALNLGGVLGTPEDAASGDEGMVLADPSSRGGVPGVIVEPGTPCHNAVHAPLASVKAGVELRQFSTTPVLPDQALARAKDAWTCGAGPAAAVVLFDELQITYEPGWSGVSAKQYFNDMAAQNESGTGKVIEVGGLPAYAADGSGEKAPSTLLVIDGDTLLRMYGLQSPDPTSLVPAAESVVQRLR